MTPRRPVKRKVQTVDCPHCGQDLRLPPLSADQPRKAKRLVVTVVDDDSGERPGCVWVEWTTTEGAPGSFSIGSVGDRAKLGLPATVRRPRRFRLIAVEDK